MSVPSQLLVGATFRTMDGRAPLAEALLIGGDGTIAAVGRLSDLRRKAKGAAEVDLSGCCVVPGFIDAHQHFCFAALDRGTPDLHVPHGTAARELVGLIEAYANAHPGHGWLRLGGWDRSKVAEGRGPTRAELDVACPARPLVVYAYDFHEAVLNSAGLEAMGWHDGCPDPPHGALGRDRRGRLTGEALEGAFFLAEVASRSGLSAPSDDHWLAGCHAHARDLLACGITRVGDAAVPPDFERLYTRAVDSGKLPLTVHRMPVGARSVLQARTDAQATGEGPATAPAGPAKFFVDGTDAAALQLDRGQLLKATVAAARAVGRAGLPGLRAALRSAGWRRGSDGLFHRGMLFWDQPRLDDRVREAAQRGLQVAQHAIGNEAVLRAVASMEASAALLEALPGRPRVEHAHIIDGVIAQRMADAGIAAVVQPAFVWDLGDALGLLPVPAPLTPFGYRTMRDHGVVVAGSSDYPVATFDVLRAVEAAVTRSTRQSERYHPEEALTVQEALEAYTSGAAVALGVEDQAGRIAPGLRADLAVLGADPLAVAPDRLHRIPVLRTYVGGRLEHELDSVPATPSAQRSVA